MRRSSIVYNELLHHKQNSWIHGRDPLAPESHIGLMHKPSQASELQKLQKRNQLLESLSDVGVALAGSFDIRAILETTHDAASRLAESTAVDVLYLGCDAINSKPMWYPAEPSVSGLTQPVRNAVLSRSEELEGNYRRLPISYQSERLGCLFVTPLTDADAETERLLSILTLQAATALRNIHSTQERIHFERLSAVGSMIGSVVHDFRSPLTALRGYAGMLTNLKLNDGERAAYGRYVIEECDRLNYMVSELLEFTRGGGFELEPTSLPVRPFLEGLAGRVRAHFGNRGIRVELDLDDTEELFVDKERMDRALWNVAANACQAMPEGGVVRIRVLRRDDTVTLSIQDEGSGIPEHVRHRIFEPFFSHGKAEGIGLGMLIARKIVEEHGGAIAVESEEGVGTVVRFELPLTVPEKAIAATAANTAD